MDDDFTGLHGREPQDLSASAHSHTEYIMFFCSCPLIWKSQLQTETAFNTFHAEHVALLSAIQNLITIQQILQELVHCLYMTYTTPVIHAEVLEYNNSAYLLAMTHCLSELSKHLNVKWNFFWEYEDEGHANISHCSSNVNEQTIPQKVWFLRDLKRIEKVIMAGDH